MVRTIVHILRGCRALVLSLHRESVQRDVYGVAMNKSTIKKALIAASIVGTAVNSKSGKNFTAVVDEWETEGDRILAKSGEITGKRSKGDRKRNPRWRRR